MFNSFRASSALFVAPLDLFTASSVSVFLIHHSITPFSIRVRTGVRIPFFPPSFSLSPYLLPSSSCPCASFSTSFLSIKTTVLLFTVHHAKKLRGEWRGRKKERGSKGGRAIISYSLAWTVNSLLLYISSNPPLLPPPTPPFPAHLPFSYEVLVVSEGFSFCPTSPLALRLLPSLPPPLLCTCRASCCSHCSLHMPSIPSSFPSSPSPSHSRYPCAQSIRTLQACSILPY